MSSCETPIFRSEEFLVFPNRVVQRNGREAVVAGDGTVWSYGNRERPSWKMSGGVKELASYEGPIPVLNAAYDLAVREFLESRGDEGVLLTGASWGKSVWTRDVSFATTLGLGMVDPDICMASLKVRVSHGEVMQDTGTGGSWPISTDRVAWGIAAWDLYLITGDREWLEWSAKVLDRTCLHDILVVDELSGLVRGESSFLDWRSQSYPDWMTPADIGESCSLSTMALHARCRAILGEMYAELGDQSKAGYWKKAAERVRKAIETMFRIPHRPAYGQFLYGRGYPVLSERLDTLGSLLCLLFGIVDGEEAASFLYELPHCLMGVPCFHPQKTMTAMDYHNGTMWPFLEGFYAQTAASLGNEDAMSASLACLVRSSLINGTNKENISLIHGTDEGLVQSSDRQLWSIAGTLGVFLKGLFGIWCENDSLMLSPCVPKEWAGRHVLMGVKYRKATIDVILLGHGSQVGKCMVNGKTGVPVIEKSAEGHFIVEIELLPGDPSVNGINWSPVSYDLPSPQWIHEGNELRWEPVPDAWYYRVYRNGIPIAQTEQTVFVPHPMAAVNQYQVMAVSKDDRESFLNEPREYIPGNARVETRPCGLSGDDVWVSRMDGSRHAYFYDVILGQSGVYRVDAFFSNGSGDYKDGNTCALRSLVLNGKRVGSLVFPHMNTQGDWGNFFYTPGLDVPLAAGIYNVELTYGEEDENINHDVNDCLIKHMRFTRISP